MDDVDYGVGWGYYHSGKLHFPTLTGYPRVAGQPTATVLGSVMSRGMIPTSFS